MSDELSADDAASIYTFYNLCKRDAAKTVRIMIVFRNKKTESKSKIVKACKLFFADPKRHSSRAIKFEKEKKRLEQIAAKIERAKIKTDIQKKRDAGKFTWTWPKRDTPIKTNRVVETERFLGLYLPDDYKQFACKHIGLPKLPDAPEETLCVQVDTKYGGKGEEMYLWDFYDPIRIRQELEEEIEGLPKALVPFANDMVGNYFCFDYRKKSTFPTVVLWDHEAIEVYPVAKSFTAFLADLKPSRRYMKG